MKHTVAALQLFAVVATLALGSREALRLGWTVWQVAATLIAAGVFFGGAAILLVIDSTRAKKEEPQAKGAWSGFPGDDFEEGPPAGDRPCRPGDYPADL